MQNKTIGVLGCSSIAKKAVIPAITECNGLILSGVASRTPEKAASFAKENNTEAFSYEELIASNVDAIYVSLPVGLHYEWGKRVLDSGKHLLMEKTFTETYAQAQELFQLAQEKELCCMEALMYRYHPLQLQIKSLLRDIGKVQRVEAHFGFPHFDNKNDIRYNKALGGGAMLDCLIYPLSFVFSILGSNYRDMLHSNYYDINTGVDERGYIQLEYPETVANISYGFGHSYRNEVTIWGENGILKSQRAFTRPPQCDIPIEIWSNGRCEEHPTDKENHFVNMLNVFSEELDGKLSLDIDVLERIAFIEKLKN
jgi:predicted dehydrogenase